MIRVDIYTTSRLVDKYCNGECLLRGQCQPQVAQTGNDVSGMNNRVKGQMEVSECPIVAREYPPTGWVAAQNHTGRCGYQA